MYLTLIGTALVCGLFSCRQKPADKSASAQGGIPTIEKVGPICMPDTIAPVTAPFEMPQPVLPTFPDREMTVEMPAEGMATAAIQGAIDQVAAQGGGTVRIPQGVWQTGRITLKSNIHLKLDEGAELHFSGKVKDYLPVVFTRDEGIELYSLGAFIYAHKAENIALTGKGRIVGPSTDCEIFQINKEKAINIEKIILPSMPVEERIYDGTTHPQVFLPKTFAPIHCKNVLIEGVHLDQGLYWNVVPQYCENVIIRGVTVTSFGHGRTDGIDVESSKNVLIEYCSLDCQDDCYTIKSGRGYDGLRVNRPTENVVIRHSLALRGAGGIVCGTETAGGIKNIYMHDCVFDGTDRGFRFKARRTRGGTISNIYIERVRASLIYDAVYSDQLGSVKWMGDLAARYPVPPVTELTPEYRNVSIHDVIIEKCRNMIVIEGMPERPMKTLFFGNATVTCENLGYIHDASGVSMKDLLIHSKDSTLEIDNADYASFYGLNNLTTGKPVLIEKVGEESKYLNVQEVGLKPETYTSVRSGKVWLDTNGKPIHAHAFQMFYKDGTYYWYGENKEDALLGTNRMFGGFRLYTSTDFYNWKDEGLILEPDSVNPLSPIHYSQKLERPHIIYNEKTGKYVCWAKSQDTAGYFVILTADDFRGPYTFVRNLRPQGYGVGDFDVYVDPDTQKAYVWFERPHWEMICSDLTDDYTDVVPDSYTTHWSGMRPPVTREAPAHFIKDGKFYMYTSGTTGYTPNPTQAHVFTDPHGEYTDLGDPHIGDPYTHSFNSQICCVIRIPGKKDLYVALADRWLPQVTNTDIPMREAASKVKSYANHRPNPKDFSVPQVKNRQYTLIGPSHDVYDATYVFLPVVFKDGVPTIEWKDEWRLEDYE
ncbi:MAG: family 43 glycosylhydrolase [Bacteroides sp.]|nr:family 43 glycosylhydrolase [Bacteroides sp.]